MPIVLLNQRRPKQRHGLNLVELLIVISIIGMLISLLLPAVQSSREAARRTECLNKSRQQALAVQQYHDATQQYPPSRIRDRFLTWAALTAPYIEESAILDGVDFNGTFNGQPQVFRETSIQLHLCPSREHTSYLVVNREIPGIVGDYAAITGTFVMEGVHGEFLDGILILGESELQSDHDGLLKSWKSRTATKDVLDGLSKTFLIGEASFWLSERVSVYDGNDNPGAFLGDKRYPLEHEHLVTKHSESPIAETESQPGTWIGSAHPEVVVISLADGSCRAIAKSAELTVLESLVTRAGEENTSVEEVAN